MKRLAVLTLSGVVGLTVLAGCANPTEDDGGQQARADDVLASVQQVDEIAAMLPASVRDAGSLAVSINLGVAPIKFVDADGDIAGLNPDLLRAAGTVLGIDIDFQEGTFDAMVPGLEAGRYDVIASIADFVERQTNIDFIDYLQNGTAIITAADFAPAEVTPDQLCGLSIGFARGTSQQGSLEAAVADCAARGEPALTINGYQDPAAGILSVQSGEADGFWGDLPQMVYNVDTDPDRFQIVYTEQGSVLGIGIRKDDPELRDALQAALLHLVEDGTYDRLLDEWGLGDFGIPEMPINSDNTLAG